MGSEERLSLTLPSSEALLLQCLQCQLHSWRHWMKLLAALEHHIQYSFTPSVCNNQPSNSEGMRIEDRATAESYKQTCPTAQHCSHLHGPGEHVGQHFFPCSGIFVSTKCFT